MSVKCKGLFVAASQTATPIMPGGQSPGTPAKIKDKAMLRAKVVVALYQFKAIEGGDLSLEKVGDFNAHMDKYTNF